MKALFKKATWLTMVLVMLLVASIVVVACDTGKDDPSGTDDVTLTFAQSSVTLTVDDVQTIALTVTGTTESATFTSSAPTVAKVEPGGATNSVKVTALSAGTAVVTAAIGDNKATLNVTVNAKAQTDSLNFVNKGISFAKGSTTGVEVQFKYTSAEEGAEPEITLSDDLFEVGAITTSGTVSSFTLTPKSGADFGYYTLTASIGGITDTLMVDICSAGIVYDSDTVSATSVAVSGLSSDFPGGKLVFPRYGYVDSEGAYILVTKIGTGAALANAGGAITEVITGDSVKTISANAFADVNIDTLAAVTFGSSVQEIGEDAFRNHAVTNKSHTPSALTTLTFAENSNLKSIGATAFGGAGIVELVLPEGLTTIGGQAFIWNNKLTTITLPESYIPVYEGASGVFWDCSNLKTVNMPAYQFVSLTMFAGCNFIETVNFGGTKAQWASMVEQTRTLYNNETNFNFNAGLWNCQNIVCTDGVLPVVLNFVTETITKLAVGKTQEIELSGKNLGDVTFTVSEEGIISIAKNTNTDSSVTATVTAQATGSVTITATYEGVIATLNVTVVDPAVDSIALSEAGHTYYTIGKNDGAVMVNFIYSSATEGGVPAIEATEGQTLIDLGAVQSVSTDDDGITTATFTITPKSNTEYGLTRITLSMGTATVITLKVEICSSGILYSYAGGENVAAVTGLSNAFPGGELHLPEYIYAEGALRYVTQIGEGSNSISNAGSTITDVYTGNMIMLICNYAFSGLQIDKIYIGQRVATIGEHAFENSGLSEIDFTSNTQLTTIGAGAFMYSTNLTELDIPDTVTTLGGQIFWNQTKIAVIHLPANLTSGDYAFQLGTDRSTQITTLYIPVYSKLPDGIFVNSYGIQQVYFSGTVAQWNAMLSASTINNNLNDTIVHCTDSDIIPVTIGFEVSEGSVTIGGNALTITVTGTSLENVTFTADKADSVTITKGTETSTSVTATVEGLAAGTVVITAACGSKTATFTLTVVNPVETSLTGEGLDWLTIGNNDGAYSYTVKYVSAVAGEVPEMTAASNDYYEIGELSTGSVDSETGLVTATFTITPKADVYGYSVLTIALGDKTVTVTVEICSSGIDFASTGSGTEVTVVGVNANFPGGMLAIPKKTVIDGVVCSVGRIGTGGEEEAIYNNSGNAITEVDTGRGVMLIMPYAFYEISTLRKATIGVYVLSIYEYAFRSSGLEEIDLSNAIRLSTIGAGAFIFAANLRELDFSECATTAVGSNVSLSIGGQAVWGGTSLTTVILPKNFNLAASGSGLMQQSGSVSITTVNMPTAYGYLPTGLFWNVTTIKTVNYNGTVEEFNNMKSASLAQDGAEGTYGSLWTAKIICTDGTIDPPVTANNLNATCYNAATVGELYSWDTAPLNLFTYAGDEDIVYTYYLGDVQIYTATNSTLFEYTFSEAGNISVRVTAQAGSSSAELTMTVVVNG